MFARTVSVVGFAVTVLSLAGCAARTNDDEGDSSALETEAAEAGLVEIPDWRWDQVFAVGQKFVIETEFSWWDDDACDAAWAAAGVHPVASLEQAHAVCTPSDFKEPLGPGKAEVTIKALTSGSVDEGYYLGVYTKIVADVRYEYPALDGSGETTVVVSENAKFRLRMDGYNGRYHHLRIGEGAVRIHPYRSVTLGLTDPQGAKSIVARGARTRLFAPAGAKAD